MAKSIADEVAVIVRVPLGVEIGAYIFERDLLTGCGLLCPNRCPAVGCPDKVRAAIFQRGPSPGCLVLQEEVIGSRCLRGHAVRLARCRRFFFLMIRPAPRSTLVPYPTLCRS